MKGPTYFGLDIVSLITLLYFGMFYATFTLISRGWCVTKGPKELSHSDRQMTFLMAFGMTITELISAGYNKFATVRTILTTCMYFGKLNNDEKVSLVFMYCIFIRMVLMSFDLLIKKLGDEVVSLSARRVAPILIQPIQSRQKLLKQLRVLSMVYFVMIISTRVSAFFIRSIAIVIAEEAIHVVVLLSWAVLLRKRKETHIKLSLEQNGRVMINSAPLMGEAVNEEANNQLHVVESPGLSVVCFLFT